VAFADVGDVKLFYTDEGEGDPPMLLVHGFSCDSNDWIWQIPHFAATRRVVAVDLRGHGHSSVPAGGFETKVFAADIATLLRQLDCGPVVAVGHSLGGAIVSALAVEHPDLVQALVCVDPGYLLPDEIGPMMQPYLDAMAVDAVGTSQSLLSNSYVESSPPQLKTWHLRRIAGVPSHVLCETVANLHTFALRSACEEYLRRRSCPVLTVYASGERVPVERALFRDPRSRAVAWDGCGHWLHQERPAEFNALVGEWLAGIGSAPA
jgi:pimeloyl-ACP methyl ester carboxylesterase